MHPAAPERMLLHRGLRRTRTEGGLDPEVFIRVAEESGIVGDVDLWVLERACRDLTAWRRDGLVRVRELGVHVALGGGSPRPSVPGRARAADQERAGRGSRWVASRR